MTISDPAHMTTNPVSPLTLAAATEAVAAADADLIRAVETWLDSMRERLDQLASSLDEHVDETEGADGLFSDVVADAPHLLNRVQWLTRDHDELIGAIEQARDLTERPGLASDGVGVNELHKAVHALIDRLHRHLHEHCRITHDAVSIDLGGDG